MSSRFVSVCASFAAMYWGDNLSRQLSLFLRVITRYMNATEARGRLKSSNVPTSDSPQLRGWRVQKCEEVEAKFRGSGIIMLPDEDDPLNNNFSLQSTLIKIFPLCLFHSFLLSVVSFFASRFAKPRTFWILCTSAYFKVPV